MIKRVASIVLALILVISGTLMPVAASSSRSSECRTVRVGYFEFPGYQEISESGEKSGYGYEYLQELKKYANWKYEYVYGSYEECLKLLQQGKIDLVTSVSYSEARDEIFDYSKASMGTKDTILTVKRTNKKYIAGEYETFDGIHVGVLSGNTSNSKFAEFSKENNFSYTYDSYDDVETLWKALQYEEVDGIITSNLRKTDNETAIAEFAPSPYYGIVKDGNKSLLSELNKAMEKIDIIRPTYQSALYQKYYGTDNGNCIAFSNDELEYIRENPNISILIPPTLRPMAYLSKDKAVGIVPEIIEKMLKPSGLHVNFTLPQSENEYKEKKEDVQQYKVIGMVDESIYKAESEGLRLTSPYMMTDYNVITKINSTKDNIIVAAVKDRDVTKNYIEKHYDKEQIKYYNSEEKCVKAVLNGAATRTIMNSHNAEYIIENDVRNRLVSNTVMGFSTEIALSVHNDADYLLFSILNKCVNALPQDDVRSIMINNTLYKDKAISPIEYLYMYPTQVIFILIGLFAIIVSIIFVAMRQKRLQKEQLALKETAYFAKIATEANGIITEVNLENKTMTEYYFKGKNLAKKENNLENFSAEETTLSDIIHPDNLLEYKEMFSKESLMELGGKEGQKSCNLRMKGSDGKYYWTLLTLQGIQADATHPNNLMIFKKDINDIKEKEEIRNHQLIDALNTAMAASEAKGTFMSRMSHEIRTPLNAVIGYMTIAKTNTQNIGKVKDCIVKGETAAKHLLAIINDVLDMSSIESGKLKISHQSFDIRELISEAATVFFSQAQEKNIKFEAITNGISEEFLIGDRLRVNQIVLNLLSNAVKFTPEGGKVYFTVEQTAIKNSKVFIKFIVSDSGIGMSDEFKKRLFTPFEQQDATIAQKFGGTGIGLSITKNLVTMMNGAIEVESEIGVGSKFIVELPFELDTTLKTPSCIIEGFENVHALIVDDEESACEYMHVLLETCGIKNKWALSGKEAVEMISKAHDANTPFDICLMDWHMPDMDGVETVKKIRKCIGDDMPIIVVTAYDFSEIEETARGVGVNLFISKPLFQSTMFDLLVNVYGKYKTKALKTKEVSYDFIGKRLLLAEDNLMNREIAVDILMQYGFCVDCAKNGKEALDMFENSKEGTYNCILMDIQMPIMNGHEATRAIRESIHQEAKTMPIIAMTANAFAEDIAASHGAGMNDHISKPIDIEQMLLVLTKHIV